jgi:actin-related protein
MSEIPSIIIDSGAHTTRVGFSGDDSPKFIFPSYINLAASGKTSAGAVKKNTLNICLSTASNFWASTRTIPEL